MIKCMNEIILKTIYLPTWQYLKIDMNIESLWYIKIKHSWKLNIYITHVNNVYDTLDVAITTAKLR